MIKSFLFVTLIGFNADAGIKPKVKTKTFKIYSFDSSKVILQSLKSKNKWVISRDLWVEKPAIGKKITLSEAYVKSLKKYKNEKSK